jgi:FtsP/CotA-like multicopper oxidase with cupredoxin domain
LHFKQQPVFLVFLIYCVCYRYHSHHSSQYVDGAWGFLIIKNTPEEAWQHAYDEERLISINDWTHRPARDISSFYLTHGNFPDTNSSLINGRGTFNCSNVEPGLSCNPSLQGPAVVNVTRGKSYRLRILNSSAAIAYNFSIDGHKLAVIETDGVDTFKSPKVDIVLILPAQRYSFLVTMDQPLGEYWIRISGEFPISTPGLHGHAILRYEPGTTIQSSQPVVESNEPYTGVLQGRPHFHDIPWNDIITSGGIKLPTIDELLQFFPKGPPKFSRDLQAQRDAEHAQMVRQTRFPTTAPVNPSSAVVLDQNQCPPLQFGVSGNAPSHYDKQFVINVTDCPIAGSPVRMCMNGLPFVPQGTNSRPVLFEVIRGNTVPASARPVSTPNHKEVSQL